MCARIAPFIAGLIFLSGFTGCWSASKSEVVVYAALDREFSEPILKDFEKETGIRVLAKYDVESTKTVGLVNAIVQEQNRPRCDLFWNNEIMHTLRLQKLGLLLSLPLPAATSYPAQFQSKDGTWYGFAARARVLIVNTELVEKSDWPVSVDALADEKWKGKCGLAKPLFGTTATHAAVLFAKLGDERAIAFFQKVKQNAQVMSGNKQVASAVGRAQLAFGLTDTDDAIIEKDQGRPVQIIFPDQAADQLGTLLIPNTIAAIKKSRNAAHAEKLANYLLSGSIETRLAEGESAQIALSRQAIPVSRVLTEQEVRWMEVDYVQAAEHWESSAKLLRDLFESAH